MEKFFAFRRKDGAWAIEKKDKLEKLMQHLSSEEGEQVKRNNLALDKALGEELFSTYGNKVGENGLFSDLGDLGLVELNVEDIYGDEHESAEEVAPKTSISKANPLDLLYDKKIKCPACEKETETRTMKIGKPNQVLSIDLDLKVNYEVIDPILYDVFVCKHCGYAVLNRYFKPLRDMQQDWIKEKLAKTFKARRYPDLYDAYVGIERYKLALLSTIVKKGSLRERATICLRLAWLYREIDDSVNEGIFLEKAKVGLEESLIKETGNRVLDDVTTMYLVGYIYFKDGEYITASRWLSQVMTDVTTKKLIKEKAQDLYAEIVRVRKEENEKNK